ncbi:MAG: tetratricopeptide repeat protein [Planctomycetia bacterium]|nr:tetratricopeptide repeat protein [Planctomycetia bacterium]
MPEVVRCAYPTVRSLALSFGILISAICLPRVASAHDDDDEVHPAAKPAAAEPSPPPSAPPADPLAAARQLYRRGHYAEAAESYELLTKREPLAATLGLARCAEAVGDVDKADKLLARLAEQHPKLASLPAQRARLAFDRGDTAAAQKLVDAAIKLDADEPLAHWIGAELLRSAGKLAEADKAYAWFVDYYNRTEKFTDPDALRWTALALAQNARWQRIDDQFGRLVNDVYPDALTIDADYWPAHLNSGLLFLEKYNQPEAVKEFKAAMKINPNAPEIYVALARLALQSYQLDEARQAAKQALKINPRLLDAQLVLADVDLANFDPASAEKALVEALKLRPTDEATLGRLAAARGALDGLEKTGPDTRLEKLAAEARSRNPHPGEFYVALAESLDTLRRWPESATYYAIAVRELPQLTGAYSQQALVEMRLGNEKQAREQLENAFKVDFGNVRVKNSLEVLDVLDKYETIETEHFIVRFDPQKDALQARALAQFLEEVYPKLTKQFGYSLPGKTLFEMFNKAKNTSGHGWFSARTVGLPHVHTIAACVGRTVAMVSPSSMKKQFNWSRVVQHEFIHVLNLQQTNYRIPHWYTEALAVYNEGAPRQEEWNRMLLERVPAGKVFNLNTINQGFIHPESSDDWQMAYCQAELYAEYMLKQYGPDALAKLLAGYADNLSTTAAIQRAFGVSVEEFEKGYTKHLKELVAGLHLPPAQPKVKFLELMKAVEADPKDADKMATLANMYLDRGAYPKAGELARAALKIKPQHPQATYVLARLDILVGNTDGVAERLNAALDRKSPHPGLLKLLAGMKYKEADYPAAAELYQLGRDRFGDDHSWAKLQARVYLKSGDNARLQPVLEEVALHDADDLTVRQKLMQLAVAAKDNAAAARWATELLHIDISDVEAHRTRAASLLELKQYPAAAAEYEIAIVLEPKKAELRIALVKAHLAAGDKVKARAALDELKKLWPDDAAIAPLEKQIGP